MKMKMMIIWLVMVLVAASSSSAAPPLGRPSVEDAPLFARWLVSQGSWGVLSTLEVEGMAPFGYVASYSDAGTGVPYFYLSPKLDPAGRDATADPRVCLTVSELTVNDCRGADPQSPLCAKIALSGKLRKLPRDSWEATTAEAALFIDHPQFAGFPKNNGSFVIFKLEISGIFLVNQPAPATDVDVKKYLKI